MLRENDLTPYQKAAIATRFASEVKYNFAGYDKFAQNYDSICRAELPNLVNTQSDEEFSEKLRLFANMLKDGHTSIGFSADVTYAPISHKKNWRQDFRYRRIFRRICSKGCSPWHRTCRHRRLAGYRIWQPVCSAIYPFIHSAVV